MRSQPDLDRTYLSVNAGRTGRPLRLFREKFDKSANEDTRGRGNEYEMRCS